MGPQRAKPPGGKAIGPDMRLESSPPFEELTPIEQARVDADPDTKPGNMRKVGPSLFRIAEKTNQDWTAKWIRAPREFRPERPSDARPVAIDPIDPVEHVMLGFGRRPSD